MITVDTVILLSLSEASLSAPVVVEELCLWVRISKQLNVNVMPSWLWQPLGLHQSALSSVDLENVHKKWFHLRRRQLSARCFQMLMASDYRHACTSGTCYPWGKTVSTWCSLILMCATMRSGHGAGLWGLTVFRYSFGLYNNDTSAISYSLSQTNKQKLSVDLYSQDMLMPSFCEAYRIYVSIYTN